MAEFTYQPAVIEPKWQEIWAERQTFRTPSIPKNCAAKPKYYVLDMFPYPSGAGLHVGHPEGYTATDIVARLKRARASTSSTRWAGTPSACPPNAPQCATASTRRRSPSATSTTSASRSSASASPTTGTARSTPRTPDYYRWTQWIFLKLYEQGLAYMAEVPVNWCPALGTVLANEEVKDGATSRPATRSSGA